MPRGVRASVLIAAALATATSCSPPAVPTTGSAFFTTGNRTTARERAAVEFKCPKDSVNVTPLLEQQDFSATLSVEACGHQVVYTCLRDGPCIKEGTFGQ